MKKINELREERLRVWEEAKAFLDIKKNGTNTISAEDEATYEKMEGNIVRLGKEIDRLERQRLIDNELSSPMRAALTGAPYLLNQKAGRGTDKYSKSFWNMMRGVTNIDISNSLTIGTDSDGGYLVPDEFERTLIEALEEENVFRRIARVVKTSNGDKKIPIVTAHGSAAWVDEEASIPEGDDAFGQITISAHKLATIMKVSEELLSESGINLPEYIAKEFARRIGKTEELAFVSGDGEGKPSGILSEVGGAQLGITTASATAITYDEVIDLYHSLKTPYRKNAVFLANDSTLKAIRKLKDGNGQYIWQPSIVLGEPDRIMGKPVECSEFMPEIASAAKTIAFGDFSYYWIADRQVRSFQRLNELYAETGQVGFKASQRVDGKLILPEAIKTLQMKA